uniref:Cytosolic carboxypeptidase N-terminal domain-containing protein n=1 Tax=Timema douglasi TaxID=61478 RepID=A0A7R8VD82_TIMDO|nr:unnamed protein product [Timema douglasi]
MTALANYATEAANIKEASVLNDWTFVSPSAPLKKLGGSMIFAMETILSPLYFFADKGTMMRSQSLCTSSCVNSTKIEHRDMNDANSDDSENEGGLGNVTRVVMRPPGQSGKAKRGHLCFDASFETVPNVQYLGKEIVPQDSQCPIHLHPLCSPSLTSGHSCAQAVNRTSGKNQIKLCRDRGLSPGPAAQKTDTLPLDHQYGAILNTRRHLPRPEWNEPVTHLKLVHPRCAKSDYETVTFHSGLGNLGRVDLISEFEYDLFIRPDTCNPRFRIWFNFIVDNIRTPGRASPQISFASSLARPDKGRFVLPAIDFLLQPGCDPFPPPYPPTSPTNTQTSSVFVALVCTENVLCKPERQIVYIQATELDVMSLPKLHRMESGRKGGKQYNERERERLWKCNVTRSAKNNLVHGTIFHEFLRRVGGYMELIRSNSSRAPPFPRRVRACRGACTLHITPICAYNSSLLSPRITHRSSLLSAHITYHSYLRTSLITPICAYNSSLLTPICAHHLSLLSPHIAHHSYLRV